MNPIVLIICVFGALIAAAIAASKNRNAFGFGLLGFLLPLIGILAAALCEPHDLPPETPTYPRV